MTLDYEEIERYCVASKDKKYVPWLVVEGNRPDTLYMQTESDLRKHSVDESIVT